MDGRYGLSERTACGIVGQPRGTQLLNDGGIEVGKDRVQRKEYPNHVWSFDFVETHTHDGRRIRLMPLIDEFTRKCLAIHGSDASAINFASSITNLQDGKLGSLRKVHFKLYVLSEHSMSSLSIRI